MAKIRNLLPSGAFQINGVFLEDTVAGYHTLNAANKWTLEKQIDTVETAARSGSIFTGSRYPAREIEIEYLIEGENWDELQASYTTLMRALDIENAQIIFNGEPDKYIRGYFSVPSDIEETYLSRHGTFNIICPDPFKYSVTEKTATALNGQFNITYNGTYRGYPTFITEFANTEDAKGDSTSTNECGFVGFVNQREKILQFGDPEQTDWDDVTYPATVPVNRTFKSTTGWTLNGSSVKTGTQVGSIAIGGTTNKYIYPSSYGSGTGYHGPSLSYIITGETAPIGMNFNFTWDQMFQGTSARRGGFECLLWNNNNGTRTLICGVKIIKKANTTKCEVSFLFGANTAIPTFKVLWSEIGESSMSKVGDTIKFNCGGVSRQYNVPGVGDLLANEITFHFLQYKSKGILENNCVYNCKLQRTSFDQYEDIKNIFAPGDVLTVNTQDAGVYLDEGSATIPATYLGALGNDWEDFYLTPGTNIIGTDYSDFTASAPTFTIKYRERFI